MIAQVIVDVAAKQTDRIFEYQVPEQIADLTTCLLYTSDAADDTR